MKNQAEDKVGIIVVMSLSNVVNFINPSNDEICWIKIVNSYLGIRVDHLQDGFYMNLKYSDMYEP